MSARRKASAHLFKISPRMACAYARSSSKSMSAFIARRLYQMSWRREARAILSLWRRARAKRRARAQEMGMAKIENNACALSAARAKKIMQKKMKSEESIIENGALSREKSAKSKQNNLFAPHHENNSISKAAFYQRRARGALL